MSDKVSKLGAALFVRMIAAMALWGVSLHTDADASDATRSPDHEFDGLAEIYEIKEVFFVVSTSLDGEAFWCAAGMYARDIQQKDASHVVHRSTEAFTGPVSIENDLITGYNADLGERSRTVASSGPIPGPRVAFRYEPKKLSVYGFLSDGERLRGHSEVVFAQPRKEKRTIGEALAGCE